MSLRIFSSIAATLHPQLHYLTFQGDSDWQVMTGGVCQVGSNHPDMGET